MDASRFIINLQETTCNLIVILKLKRRGNTKDKTTDHDSLKFKYQIMSDKEF